jgi:hypothetical protein
MKTATSYAILFTGCSNSGFAMMRSRLRDDPGLIVHVIEPVNAWAAHACGLPGK